MKKTEIVQLAIIVAGIFMAYIFITGIPSVIFALYNWFDGGLRGGSFMENFFSIFFLYGSYFLAAFLCISKSGIMANWICSKSSFDGPVHFPADKNSLLYILFIGMGIYGIAQNLPRLLVTGFNKIREHNSFMPTDDNGAGNTALASQLIMVLLYIALLVYANVFADFFAARINNQEPEDEITGDQITE